MFCVLGPSAVIFVSGIVTLYSFLSGVIIVPLVGSSLSGIVLDLPLPGLMIGIGSTGNVRRSSLISIFGSYRARISVIVLSLSTTPPSCRFTPLPIRMSLRVTLPSPLISGKPPSLAVNILTVCTFTSLSSLSFSLSSSTGIPFSSTFFSWPSSSNPSKPSRAD